MRSLETAHASYREALDVLGLDDAQVAADYRSGRLRWDLAGALAKLVVALPLALIGVVVHAVPYGVVKLASRVPDNVGMRATVKVLGSFVFYTLTYLAVGLTVGTHVRGRLGSSWPPPRHRRAGTWPSG